MAMTISSITFVNLNKSPTGLNGHLSTIAHITQTCREISYMYLIIILDYNKLKYCNDDQLSARNLSKKKL